MALSTNSLLVKPTVRQTRLVSSYVFKSWVPTVGHTSVKALPQIGQSQQTLLNPRHTSTERDGLVCRSFDPRDSNRSVGAGKSGGVQFNSIYLGIFALYGVLFALKNPYIFAALSIATIIPQNSTITSLNSLVLFFYETGLFMNFAEAVYCVRFITWLSIGCCLASFALFS